MKNKIIVLNKDKKKEYHPLIKVVEDNKNYLIYTCNEVNKCGDIICYAALYAVESGKQKLLPIEDEEKLEFLDSILVQVQNKMNKMEEE